MKSTTYTVTVTSPKIVGATVTESFSSKRAARAFAARAPKIHNGALTAKPGEVYDFTEITGNLDARKASADAFPFLATIGGSADFRGWTGSASKLTTIGGSADFQGWTGSASKLTTIGGYAYFRGWTGSASKLTTIGGSAYFQGWTGSADTSRIKTNVGQHALDIVRAAVVAAFAKHGLALNDGILAHIVASKGGVKRVRIVGQTRISYIVERDGKTAHGNTLAEARADFLMKLGNRDTTPYKAWTRATEASLQDMIVAYRVITGACGAGVSHFLAARSFPAKFTVARAIEETRGAYGGDTFAAFFANN